MSSPTPSRPDFPEHGLWQQALLIPIALIGLRLVLVGSLPALFYWAFGETTLHQTWWMLTAGILLCVLGLPTYYHLRRLFSQRHVTELNREGAIRELLAGVILGAVLVSLPMLTMWALGYWRFSGILVSTELWQGVAVALLACVFEELLFRGIMFRLLDQFWGPVWALMLSTVVFGGMHLMNPGMTGWGIIALSLEAGPLLGAAYLWRRRLWLPIGLHFGWNAAQAALWGQSVSGTGAQTGLLNGLASGPDWATGGSVGMEGSVFTVVVCVAATTIMLYRLKKRGNFSNAAARALPQREQGS